ncbi:MAG: hypothetical protein WA715_22655 [Candidatus Acidiferrum sp.]
MEIVRHQPERMQIKLSGNSIWVSAIYKDFANRLTNEQFAALPRSGGHEIRPCNAAVTAWIDIPSAAKPRSSQLQIGTAEAEP